MDLAYCYTGGKDNVECCKKAGVAEPRCLELCDGTKPISHRDGVYYAECHEVAPRIVKCNHDANNR